MSVVLKKRLKIEANIEKYRMQLRELQNNVCTHENLQKKHRANTGNYDPSSNFYWTEFTCPDCGKYWTEEGSK